MTLYTCTHIVTKLVRTSAISKVLSICLFYVLLIMVTAKDRRCISYDVEETSYFIVVIRVLEAITWTRSLTQVILMQPWTLIRNPDVCSLISLDVPHSGKCIRSMFHEVTNSPTEVCVPQFHRMSRSRKTHPVKFCRSHRQTQTSQHCPSRFVKLIFMLCSVRCHTNLLRHYSVTISAENFISVGNESFPRTP